MQDTERAPQVAIVGPGRAPDSVLDLARALGRALAISGARVWTGGGAGVMAAALEGARSAGGETVGVLPGASRRESPPNPWVQTAVLTGLGQARNLVLVLSVDVVVAVGGSWGTLSEIALARRHGRPVLLLESWRIDRGVEGPDPGCRVADTVEDAVRMVEEALVPEGSRRGKDVKT